MSDENYKETLIFLIIRGCWVLFFLNKTCQKLRPRIEGHQTKQMMSSSWWSYTYISVPVHSSWWSYTYISVPVHIYLDRQFPIRAAKFVLHCEVNRSCCFIRWKTIRRSIPVFDLKDTDPNIDFHAETHRFPTNCLEDVCSFLIFQENKKGHLDELKTFPFWHGGRNNPTLSNPEMLLIRCSYGLWAYSWCCCLNPHSEISRQRHGPSKLRDQCISFS